MYKTKKIFKSLAIVFLFGMTLQAFAAWTAPVPAGTTPPNNNPPNPVNVGPLPQEKIGALYAGGLATPVFQMTTAPVANYVLKSDASGFGSWVDVNTLVTGGGGGGTGMANPMTTLGDMIYGEAAGLPTRLPIGAPGQVLKVVNGKPAWQPYSSGGTNGWTDDGPVVRLTTSTDKVGIGTDIEQVLTEQLNITGNFKMPKTLGYPSQIGIIKSPDSIEDPTRFIHNVGTANTFLGYASGCTALNLCNTMIGHTAIGRYTGNTSNYTSIFGAYSSAGPNPNDTGIGQSSGSTAEGENAYIGAESLDNFYQPGYPYSDEYLGHRNVAFGKKAMGTFTFDGVSVDNNVALGAETMTNNFYGSNSISIGFQATGGTIDMSNIASIGANTSAGASNTMVFGNGSVAGWGFATQPAGFAMKVGTGPSNGNGAYLSYDGDWSPPSDRSKKHDIQDISYGLEDILALRPVSFKWNETNEDAIGFIAQEVEKIIPEIVSGEEGDMAISYAQITPALVKAVQELKEENEELNTLLDSLEEEAERQGY